MVPFPLSLLLRPFNALRHLPPPPAKGSRVREPPGRAEEDPRAAPGPQQAARSRYQGLPLRSATCPRFRHNETRRISFWRVVLVPQAADNQIVRLRAEYADGQRAVQELQDEIQVQRKSAPLLSSLLHAPLLMCAPFAFLPLPEATRLSCAATAFRYKRARVHTGVPRAAPSRRTKLTCRPRRR